METVHGFLTVGSDTERNRRTIGGRKDFISIRKGFSLLLDFFFLTECDSETYPLTLSVGSSWFSLPTPILRRLLGSATIPDSDAICCWKSLCSSPKLYGVLVEEATRLKYMTVLLMISSSVNILIRNYELVVF